MVPSPKVTTYDLKPQMSAPEVLSNLMEKLKDDKTVKLMTPTQMNIVSSVGSVDSHTDNGWKEVMSKISEAHPNSHLADQYGKKSVKDTQVDRIIHKHRRKKAGKKV